MASGNFKKITTTEILELLEANSDHTKFFYLYVSTSGTEEKRQRSRKLPLGQQTLDKYIQGEDSDDIDNDGSGDESDEAMDLISQPLLQLPVEENLVAQNPLLSPKSAREKAIRDVHRKILPKLLCNAHGWQKVYDKDEKITYRSLYFKIEDNIQKAAKYRDIVREEVEKFKEERGVNFKVNSLLSRPLRYDKPALEEQSMREGPTKRKKQKCIETYVK